jgi:xanthine dehydrogenase/oxidase
LYATCVAGVYRLNVEPQVYIDIQDIAELKSYSTAPALTLGGNMSLNDCIKLFNTVSKTEHNYTYTEVLAHHIDLIANVPVRNVRHLSCLYILILAK